MVTGTASMRRIAVEEAFITQDILDAARLLPDDPRDADLRMLKLHVGGGPFARRLLDLDDERIAVMDGHGIDMQLLSIASPGVQSFDAETAVSLARSANDQLAAAIARHPTRFAGLAAVAPQDPEAAAAEIERAVGTLGLSGIIINSHTHGDYLDAPQFAPLLAAAQTAGAPIYLHPRAPSPALAAPLRPDLELAIWGYQVEASLHAMRMIIGGVFDRFPNLKVVLGHGGEGVPFWLDRIDLRYGAGVIRRNPLEKLPSAYFRENFYISTSGLNWDPAVRFCIDVLGADRIMYAVDYPFEDTAFMVDRLEALTLSDAERHAISHGTAERVFGISPV